MIADKLVKLEAIDSISHESLRRTLKKLKPVMLGRVVHRSNDWGLHLTY